MSEPGSGGPVLPRQASLQPPESLAPPAPVLSLAVAIAVVSGYLEAGVLLLRRELRQTLVWASSDIVWMAPLGYLAFLAVPALLLWSLARWRPRLVTFPRAAFLLLLPAAAAILLVVARGRIHYAAQAVLAAGLAAAAARAVRSRETRAAALCRRAAPALLASVALLAVACPGWRALQEQRALERLSPLPPAGPSVLLVVLDTVRADRLSLHGYRRRTTPRLEAWAARGVTFKRAIATAPWTLPSHGTLFTGHFPHELRASFTRPLEGRFPTLAETFRRHGYLTAGFTANFYYTTRESGLARGFDHYDDHRISVGEVWRSSMPGQVVEAVRRGDLDRERIAERRSAAAVGRSFLRWLRSRGGRPFFAFLNFLDAHMPYEAPEPCWSEFEGDRSPGDAYDAAIAHLDDQLGRLLDELHQRGLLESTVVAITSDHGEMLGEHGLEGHTKGIYRPLLHVPLVLLQPGRIPAGQRVAATVSLRDLPATLLDLAGLRRHALPGHSLARWWHSGTPEAVPRPPDPAARLAVLREAPAALSEYGRKGPRSLLAAGLHYIRVGRQEFLYDTAADPLELKDLAGTEAWRPVLRHQARTLDSLSAPGVFAGARPR